MHVRRGRLHQMGRPNPEPEPEPERDSLRGTTSLMRPRRPGPGPRRSPPPSGPTGRPEPITLMTSKPRVSEPTSHLTTLSRQSVSGFLHETAGGRPTSSEILTGALPQAPTDCN